jgi:hypothetical protein
MKPLLLRSRIMAGVFGSLCVFHPEIVTAQGVPLKERGRPVGEDATPMGENAVKVGEGAVTIGEGAVPLSKNGLKVGESAGPVGENADPARKGGTPVGEGATPVGEDAVSISKSGAPVGENAVPLKNGAIPVGDQAVYNEKLRQRRLQNRAAAMSDPATSRFFGGEAGVRVSGVSKNVAAASFYPTNLTGPSIAQQDVQDREWSLAVVNSAASRPRDLFTKEWWSARPDVLGGPNPYYKDKADFAFWQGSPWEVLIRALGMKDSVQPFKYRNDQNIAFQNDVIYVNGQPVSSYEDFVAAARALANTHPAGTNDRPGWFPLGTFAVSSSAPGKTSNQVIQLAMDGVGNISGVYVIWPQGNVLPISGCVDTTSQLVAFTIGGGDNMVMETGLANLTEEYTRVWVHLPSSHSQTWMITRLKP